ncbi:hypothetical protein Q3G72_019205 [Acer saccharum]|nr:hypothetical protein Q3G72_019205 [Acer saccharum]
MSRRSRVRAPPGPESFLGIIFCQMVCKYYNLSARLFSTKNLECPSPQKSFYRVFCCFFPGLCKIEYGH